MSFMPYSREELEAILSSGNDAAQMDPDIERMKAQIEQLRAGSKLSGLRDAGRLVVAPHWTEGLAALANSAGENVMSNRMTGMQKQQAQIQTDQSNKILQMLLRQRQPMQPQQLPPDDNNPMPNAARIPMDT